MESPSMSSEEILRLYVAQGVRTYYGGGKEETGTFHIVDHELLFLALLFAFLLLFGFLL